MNDAVQLSFDGGSTPVANLPARASASIRLTGVQAAILRVVDKQGHIRSVEAGVIVHEARTSGGLRCKGGHEWEYQKDENGKWVPVQVKRDRVACCKWSSADGLAACRSLARRGIIVQQGRAGIWTRPDPDACQACGGTGVNPAVAYAKERGPRQGDPRCVVCVRPSS